MTVTQVLPLLGEAALKGTVVFGLASLASIWLRRGSAAARHLVWHVAVIAVLVLPLASALVPAWRVVPTFRTAVTPPPTSSLSDQQGYSAGIDESDDGGATAPVSTAQSQFRTSHTESVLSPIARIRALPPMTMLLIVWSIGAALVLARFALGTLVVHWYTWRSTPVNADAWASLNETMSFAVGLGHPVKLLRSERATTPMTFGVLNPVVLLPADADEWPEERRRIVLLHELAHVRRLDSLTNMFATLACALYWFNPLVWVAVRRMRAEGERACDDWVLRAGMRASTYAEHLLDMVKTIGRMHTPAAALPMAQRSTFEGRLLAILEPDMNRNGTRRGQAVLLTCVLGLVVFPLAAMSEAPAATAEANTVVIPSDRGATPVASPLERLGAKLGFGTRQDLPVASDDMDADADENQEPAKLSDTALNALIGVLDDVSPEVRLSAIEALGQEGDPRAIAALSNALRTDKDASVRRSAAWALGQIEHVGGVPALSDAVKSDSDMEVRRTSAWALGQIEAESGVAPLVAVLRDADAELRSTAVWALGEIESASAVPALSGMLKDSDVEVRKNVVWALGQIESATAVDPLIGIIGDGDVEVRKQVAWALGEIESDRAVEGLSNMLRNDRDVEVRGTAAWALGMIESEAAVPALSAALRDADATVRAQAAWALGQIEHTPAPEALLGALRDTDVEVRRSAIWALGEIADPKSVEAVRAALRDADEEVKSNALRVLARLRDPAAYEALADQLKSPDANVRKRAAEALGGNGGGWNEPRPQPRPQPRPAPRPHGF